MLKSNREAMTLEAKKAIVGGKKEYEKHN